MSNNLNRQLNIEILRILSMLLITVWHIRVHYMADLHDDGSLARTFMDYLMYFIPFHVNLFILIMGYFGIRNCRKKLINTLLLLYFYSISINVILWISGEGFNVSDAFLPVSGNTWWFMTVYTVMLMVAPIIERYVSEASVKSVNMLVLGGLFVNFYLGFIRQVNNIYDYGYGLVNFTSVYLIGVWIRIVGTRLLTPPRYSRTLVFMAICLIMAAQYYLIPYKTWSRMTAYCGPYALTMSVLVFIFFSTLKIPEYFRKPVLFLSSSAIAVYMITDHAAIRSMLVKPFSEFFLPYNNGVSGVLVIILVTLSAYTVSCVIDKIRIGVTAYLNKKVCHLLNI